MENTKTKQQKLREEYEAKLAMAAQEEDFEKKVGIPLEMFANTNYLGTTFYVDLSKEDTNSIADILSKIVATYPSVNKTTEIEYKGKITHYSGFLLGTKSNCKSKDDFVLIYATNENTDLRIHLPMEFFSADVLEGFERNVTDSEYGHYSGLAAKDMPRVHSRRLKAFRNLAYYGGYYKHIIDKEEDKAAYEHLVMFGCLPKI
jgi:hypothetical protein